MPSDRKQFNVRLDDETEALLPDLTERVSAAVGLRVTTSDLLRMGLRALAEKYPAPPKGKKIQKSAGQV